MAFPDDVLADEEELVLHLRPHWKAAVAPVLVLLLTLAGFILAWVMLPETEGGRIGLLMVATIMLWYAVRNGVTPLVAWRCTHYVLTDERILVQQGVLTRERRDLPLNRVNDHSLAQSLLDRILGSGTLTVDSIGEQSAKLAGVPAAQQVQTLLYELIERAPADDEDEEEEAVEEPAPRRRLFRN
ncbi:PH domain-containing protein [Actinoplanes sp. GCM10030250]|uniref:PH domain-containing protein n=1 Tax=Actinoplanes sp. GCM10030250 TaxID=3273376 RepID=UPI0036078D7C